LEVLFVCSGINNTFSFSGTYFADSIVHNVSNQAVYYVGVLNSNNDPITTIHTTSPQYYHLWMSNGTFSVEKMTISYGGSNFIFSQSPTYTIFFLYGLLCCDE
jgi:hypothetical protein